MKEIIFKYKNAYSGSYLAGIFDVKGGRDSHGIFIRDVTPSDVILIERLGFHTEKKFGQMHIINGVSFLEFIKEYRAK